MAASAGCRPSSRWHGSLDRELRDWVERGLKNGVLKAVVCTSSLDLGVDFVPVARVLQLGSPKGVARLLQRAVRSGHVPGRTNRVTCVPTHSFELVEAAAARLAARARAIESRRPPTKPLDVLVQHLVTIALGGGFAVDERGIHRVHDTGIARRHRMSIGTIVSDAAMELRFVTGARIGHVEESFVAMLSKGDPFLFAGRLLEDGARPRGDRIANAAATSGGQGHLHLYTERIQMKAPKTGSDIGAWDVDGELVARARGGDAIAFELLVVKYQRRVAALIRSLVRRADITEELTQETFLNAYDHLADLREGVAFWAWLSVIARNVASGYLRRPQVRVDNRATGADPEAPEAGQLEFAASPEQEAIARELFETIDRAVDELPAKQRDALLLREVDGLDYSAIAATLGVPVNTVRSLIFRAREAIATKVRPYLSPTRSRRW